MRWTLEQLEAWRGREALDADAEPAGEVVATFVDEQTHAPRWLAVRTGAHGDDVSPVPVDGAEPTGRAIRLSQPADRIVAAPHLAPDASLTSEQERELFAFYGLQDGPVPSPQPRGGGPGVDASVVAALREAHALEREAHTRLEALIKAFDDVELQHDAARHLTETEGHAAAIAGRLEQLESAPSSLRDLFGLARSIATPPGGTAALLRAALEFERREYATYDQLIGTARAAGDESTAQIAEKIRADEEAMAETIASALRRMGAPAQP